jgi:hypothetical protein
MNPNWAEENLQTIRTLMERSALYRRALAPIMIFVGVVGIIGGLVGRFSSIKSNCGFVWLWIVVAVVSLAGALLLVRRQALKALLPGFIAGLLLAILSLIASAAPRIEDEYADVLQRILTILWLWFYGFAIHAAGFFTLRGVRWFGWIFMLMGFVLLVCAFVMRDDLMAMSPHLLMGEIFGGLHLAYGIYLYFTEKKNPVA